MMKKNDLILVNKMLEKCADHEEGLTKNREEIEEIMMKIREFGDFKKEFKQMLVKTNNSIAENGEKIKKIQSDFTDFTEIKFPEYMVEFKEECIFEVIEKVNDINSKVVTVDMLDEKLESERNGNI